MTHIFDNSKRGVPPRTRSDGRRDCGCVTGMDIAALRPSNCSCTLFYYGNMILRRTIRKLTERLFRVSPPILQQVDNPMSEDRITEQLAFLAEIDALKSVVRQSPLADRSRRENSAEHSWHLAMFALILADDEAVDTGQVIKLLLVHDIVEIDAGDAPIHGNHNSQDIEARENAAAERLFGLLPDDQAAKLSALWREFEAAETPEARFAKALDRLQPLLLNTLTGGGTWNENDVSEQQIHERYGPPIERGSATLWRHAKERVRQHFADINRGQ